MTASRVRRWTTTVLEKDKRGKTKVQQRPNDTGQNVGVTQVGERIWLVTFMQYDLGYFDDETCRLEPIENPFGRKLLPLRSE
jgi:hypothetical protein